MPTFDEQLLEAAQEFATKIAELVRANINQTFGGGSVTTARRGRPLGFKPKKYNTPAHCIAPGCKNSHGGPASGWLCEEHQKLPAAEKAKIKAARKMGKAAGNTATTAPKKQKRKLSAEARKKLSEAAKKRWAKPGARKKTAPKKVARKPKVEAKEKKAA